jgi:hypothetical protein
MHMSSVKISFWLVQTLIRLSRYFVISIFFDSPDNFENTRVEVYLKPTWIEEKTFLINCCNFTLKILIRYYITWMACSMFGWRLSWNGENIDFVILISLVRFSFKATFLRDNWSRILSLSVIVTLGWFTNRISNRSLADYSVIGDTIRLSKKAGNEDW